MSKCHIVSILFLVLFAGMVTGQESKGQNEKKPEEAPVVTEGKPVPAKPVPAEPVPAEPSKTRVLVTRTYQVPSDLPNQLKAVKVQAKPTDSYADPFAAPEVGAVPLRVEESVEEVLKALGVFFTEGTKAEFRETEARLIVTNTAEQLSRVEEILEEVRSRGSKVIHIYVEYIEVDHTEFSDWLFSNVLDSDGTELRNEVQKWIREGRAEIIESATVAARSGQRAKTESIDEYIYPTEYDPPEIPTEVTLKDGAEAPVSAVTPTAFETRNVGVTVEVDPVIGADDRTLDINIAPEIVKLEEIRHWHHQATDPKFKTHMPTFYTMKLTTQVTATDGRYAFLGTTRPLKAADPKRKNPIVLQFVRGDVGSILDWGEEK
ncbi:MAG: hypothetical protein P1U85_10515 [Verrucomicrobiales bacterium]|nr:hypothetical protein [Verrucomicrobiales bacterium]